MRKYEKSLLIGFNETGKTHFLIEKVIKPILKSDPGKKIVIVSSTADDETLAKFIPPRNKLTSIKQLENWKGGGLVHFWDRQIAENGDLAIIIALHKMWKRKKGTYGAYIFDDSTNYLSGTALPKVFISITNDYRHFCLDIFFTFHSLIDVPPTLWRKMQILYLKKTNDGNLTLKELQKDRKALNPVLILEAYKKLSLIPMKINGVNNTPHIWTTYKIDLLGSTIVKV